MAKKHYILDSVLFNLIESTTHYFRDEVLYLELDSDNFMVNVSYNAHDGLDDCDVWLNGEQYDLTDLQEEKIRIKAMHLHSDELEDIENKGTNILY